MKKCFFRFLCICFSIISLIAIFLVIHSLSAANKGLFSDNGVSLAVLTVGSAVILIAIVGAVWCHRKCNRLKNRDLYSHYNRP